MRVISSTNQQNDPHGLAVVAELLQHGTDDDFEAMVAARTDEVRRLETLLRRVQRLTPGIEFSPHVMRILQVMSKQESARQLAVA